MLPVRLEEVPHDEVDLRMERTLEDWGMLFIMNASRLTLANGITSVLSRGLPPDLTTRLVIRMIEFLTASLMPTEVGAETLTEDQFIQVKHLLRAIWSPATNSDSI